MQRISRKRRLVAGVIAATGLLVTTGTAAGGMAGDKLDTYVKARQQLERDDPSMKRALEAGDFSGRMDTVRSALRGSQMSADEFVQMHEQVQSDPSLKAQVEAQIGAAAGTSGAAPAASPQ